MSLNIKNPEAHRLAQELARLRGISLTAAVTEAVREKLEREKAAQASGDGREGLAEWLIKISRETAPLMNDGKSSIELLDELYDDKTGLPR